MVGSARAGPRKLFKSIEMLASHGPATGGWRFRARPMAGVIHTSPLLAGPGNRRCEKQKPGYSYQSLVFNCDSFAAINA
jgi:hypothetical protein